jgi:ATP-binding cassette subfamily F protein uup
MRNPNFLVLDEPTNDLDIVTLNILEEYLSAFKGCVIVVSHDRYFMDKVVDHLLVFQGDAKVRDFPGNYTQYRDEKEEDEKRQREEQVKSTKKETKTSGSENQNNNQSAKKKMSFKEQKEFESLEAEIAELEQEKADIEQFLSSGDAEHDAILKASERFAYLSEIIDEKTMRWLELSEL